MDDKPVYHTVLDFGSSRSVLAQIGRNTVGPGASGRAFSGEIVSSRPLPLSPPEPPMQAGWMRNPIDFTFSMIPSGPPAHEDAFFTALDSRSRRTSLAIRHASASRIRFIFRTSGQPGIGGPDLEMPSPGSHRLLLFVGPWLPDAPLALRQSVEVRLDDAVVLSGSVDGAMDGPSIALAGRSDAGASPALAPFGGYITQAVPVPVAASALTPGERDRLSYGPWRLNVRFPASAPAGYHDPLLVSGVAGKGDFIYVFYPSPGSVAFSHDSWGYGGETSSAVAVDLNADHRVEIEHGGLFPPLGDPVWSQIPEAGRADHKSRLRIKLDGVVILDGASHSDDASPASVTPGVNLIGGSSTGPRFLGRILSAERERW